MTNLQATFHFIVPSLTPLLLSHIFHAGHKPPLKTFRDSLFVQDVHQTRKFQNRVGNQCKAAVAILGGLKALRI